MRRELWTVIALAVALASGIGGSISLSSEIRKWRAEEHSHAYAMILPREAMATAGPLLPDRPVALPDDFMSRIRSYGKQVPIWAQLAYLVCLMMGVLAAESRRRNWNPRRLIAHVVAPGLLLYAVVWPILLVVAKEEFSVYSFVMAFSFGFFWRGFIPRV